MRHHLKHTVRHTTNNKLLTSQQMRRVRLSNELLSAYIKSLAEQMSVNIAYANSNKKNKHNNLRYVMSLALCDLGKQRPNTKQRNLNSLKTT